LLIENGGGVYLLSNGTIKTNLLMNKASASPTKGAALEKAVLLKVTFKKKRKS